MHGKVEAMLAAAKTIRAQPQPISLDPAEARHHIPDGAAVTEQIDRPTTSRKTTDLTVPCECGRTLLGIEPSLIQDADGGWSLFVMGVCLQCGVQRVIYTSPHQDQRPTDDELRATIRNEIDRVMDDVLGLIAAEEQRHREQSAA